MMKHFLLFFTLLMLALSSAHAQSVYKFNVSHGSSRKTGDETWGDHKDLNILGVYNTKDSSFTFYGKKTLRYDVLSIEDAKVDSDGDTYYMMSCIDDDGDKVTGKLLHYKDSTRKQFYLVYSGIVFCYDMTLVSTGGDD